MKKVFYFMLCAIMAVTMISCGEKSSSNHSSNVSSSNRGISDTKYQEEDKSSTQWKRFAGDSYRASELVNNIWQNYAFNFKL